MSEKYLLKVCDVSKSFRGEQVLRNVNLEFESGKIYGIVGRNGSGKSVLFKIISGFLQPDSGYVSANGKVVGKDVDFPADMGVIIENPGFIWYQSAKANLEYLAGIRKIIDRDQVAESIRKVGLDPASKKWVGRYSLGMKQRLGIAQAIMENPRLIILDEPMNGLDEQGVADMRKLFLELRDQDKLILLASHNKEDISSLCDTVYKAEQGNMTLFR